MAHTRLLPGVPIIESPLFDADDPALDWTEAERETGRALARDGYAVIDFPDAEIGERIDRIKARLGGRFGIDFGDPEAIKAAAGRRLQDAWKYDEDVKAIAANPGVLALLGKLWGRPAFPFQTLNFPVGTQQALHSDSVHFSSIPERFMCGVWLAMEDVRADAGPLHYITGSHRWPVMSNAAIGRRGWGTSRELAQDPFQPAWDALVARQGLAAEQFLARKGQALIWCANLLHGGSPQADLTLTRWSQVTHYYFDDCVYYTPAFSDEALGRLQLRRIVNIADGNVKPNLYLGEEVVKYRKPKKSLWKKLAG